MVFLDLRDREGIGVQLAHLAIWANLDLLDQEEPRERLGTLGLRENKEKLESLEQGDRG